MIAIWKFLKGGRVFDQFNSARRDAEKEALVQLIAGGLEDL
jgi:hypothetical protein